MSRLQIVSCTETDLDLLALMNKQLIEDEQHDNPMDIEQLEHRMGEFIASDYHAYLFKLDEEVQGYALVNYRSSPIYLRQFFICRAYRRQGIGRAAFDLLLNHLQIDQIDLEVMSWNTRGYEFWKSLGFVERSVYMRLERGESQGDQ